MTKKFQVNDDLTLMRMASNICQEDITDCIIITMDKQDNVKVYNPNPDDELHDNLMVAALGEDVLDIVLRYMNLDHLKLFIDPEELE